MSYLQARTDIASVIQSIQTAWTDYTLVVETDNRNNVNYDTQTNPFLQVDTKFMGGEQIDMSDAPIVAQYGQIILSVVSKVGSGTVVSGKLVDFVIPYFDMKEFTCIRTKAAEVQASKPINGWFYQPVLINFWYHRH